MFVRYCSPCLPMFLRCLMLMLSGPVECVVLAVFDCCVYLFCCDVYLCWL